MANPRQRVRQGELGSALMLMPAAVLVVLMMLGIAVDESRVFLARRELVDLAATAANDAATRGLDEAHFRAEGTFVLSEAAVERSVAATLATASLSVPVERSEVTLDAAGPSVTVTLSADVAPLFRLLPRTRHLEVSASATTALR